MAYKLPASFGTFDSPRRDYSARSPFASVTEEGQSEPRTTDDGQRLQRLSYAPRDFQPIGLAPALLPMSANPGLALLHMQDSCSGYTAHCHDQGVQLSPTAMNSSAWAARVPDSELLAFLHQVADRSQHLNSRSVDDGETFYRCHRPCYPPSHPGAC